ncbi:fermitin family homolog 2-like isoform X1 [Mercenaria mercenaria]|uniref:fermitin family homolog 2-like isoform X1 n=1 Tax=Mercenaria mercenaria TaxID=6596 RepID=UPI00234F2874|nr:fermitin family homolog 2-like isoform X1 [Mercenaria mercenaria]
MAYLGGADRVDGSWELNILVTDLQVERTLRVNGDLHIGGVMVKLVDALDIAMDWSDHALWWPEKNRWLKRSRSTLDQYGVQADAKLHFTPMHKNLRVQLPDLQILDMRPDFSSEVFHSVQFLCKELGIRHPEEMSLMKKFDKEDLKKNIKETLNQKDKKKKKDSKLDDSLNVNGNGTLHHNSQNSLDRLSPYNRSPMGPSPSISLGQFYEYNTLQHMPGTPGTPGSPYNTLSPNGNLSMLNGTMSPGSMYSLSFESAMESALANSPPVTTKEAFQYLNRPKNLLEKARVNYAWLDSSRSLMEQGVRDNDFTLLKFKFYNFYDLNPKYDAVRINQIYEQAKWAIISEELDCTEEEAMMFGALQVQVQLQSGSSSGNDTVDASMTQEGGDDIDAALSDLQESLEGSNLSSPGDITHIPELADYVKFLKPKKFTLKSYKRYWCSFRDTHVAFYRTKEDSTGAPINRINFKGCEAHPDVNLHHKKYGIKLYIPGPDGMEEIWLRFESEEQYCKWMAACKLASKGKTMADSSYETEVQSLMKLLSMQKTTSAPDNKIITPNQLDINPEDFVSPRHYKKVKAKQTVHRIMEAHSNVRDMGLVEAKLAYIRAWQALPEFGISYFVIKMLNGKKEEILGIHPNKVIRMDMNSGDSLKTWRYDSLRSWHVNWEVRNVILDFEEGKVVFSSLSADCKVVHEFIGGYIFLSMRSQDKSQTLDVELFHKLTGGRS